jgi:hypothetical protein
VSAVEEIQAGVNRLADGPRTDVTVAQCDLLFAALGGARDMDEGATPDEPAGTMSALALARAINGVTS